MAFIIRSSNGEIKTFMETPAGSVLEPGETIEETDLSFAAFSRLLRLVVNGHAGELVQMSAANGPVIVDVDCPGETQVGLNINGLEETIPLVEGKGTLTLSSDVSGTFVITPADRTKYCAAGEALCIVEVME